MSSANLTTIFRSYLDSVNNKNLEDIKQLLHEVIDYNDSHISRDDYLQRAAAAAPEYGTVHLRVDGLTVNDAA